jgi:hypothetical protein
MNGYAWIPDGVSQPGRLAEIDLPVLDRSERHLALPDVTVIDVQPGSLLGGDDLYFDHGRGGGPLAPPASNNAARAFGVVNVAHHLQHGLDVIAELLGRSLPPLVAKIGVHKEDPSWGGAHYRLPARTYSELPEPDPVAPTGEIHFSLGSHYVPATGGRYFACPSHNPAIIYHELGHHLCRHTADFRLNRRRHPALQGNRKIPLDEGTSDYLAAILMGNPDIFGWQRADVPRSSQQRRCLDVPWTMRHFRGSCAHDPHIEGTVWAAALWSTRRAAERAGIVPRAFDRIVLRGLDRLGSWDNDLDWDEALRRRRHFSRFLEAMLQVDVEDGGTCGAVIERSFDAHGIVVGRSNRDLRDAARQPIFAPAG